jgi:hypothetical protein
MSKRAVGNQVHDLDGTLLEQRADRHAAVVAPEMHGKAQVDLVVGRNEYETRALCHFLCRS